MKIEYIDNSATQYDHNASEIKIPNNSNNIKYKLYFGDYLSASFVQLKHRNIKFVVCGSRDLFMFSKEPNVNYLNIDPNDDTKDIPKTYEFIENALKEGNCLVHGESGGAAIVLYYILVKSNTSLATTLKILKRDRNFPNIRQNVVKYLLIKEKLQLGTNSVYLGGKGDRELLYIGGKSINESFSKQGEKKLKKNNNNGIMALFIVIAFVIAIFSVIYMITGKI